MMEIKRRSQETILAGATRRCVAPVFILLQPTGVVLLTARYRSKTKSDLRVLRNDDYVQMVSFEDKVLGLFHKDEIDVLPDDAKQSTWYSVGASEETGTFHQRILQIREVQ